MSSHPIKVNTSESRNPAGAGPRRKGKAARGEMLRRVALEAMALEPRTLMATLPPSVFTGTTLVDRSGTGNMSTPSIAIDRNNPQKLAAVWTLNDPTFAPGPTEVVRVATSPDGGATWQLQGAPGPFLIDPTSAATSPVPYAQAFNASVAFDRNDNFYVLYEQSQAGAETATVASAAMLLSKYNFSSAAPARTLTNSVVYQFVTANPAFFPTLAVDDTLPTFSDVGADGVTRTVTNPASGNVYVAIAEDLDEPSLVPPPAVDPYALLVYASTDGGTSFSPPRTMNGTGTFFGLGSLSTPRIAVSQGRAPGTNGTTDPGVAPGTLSAVWDDWSTGQSASPPFDRIVANHATGAFAQSFASNGGLIQDALKGNNGPDSPVTTDFPINVNLNPAKFTTLSDLSVAVAIVHPQDAELSIQLVPPAGSGLAPVTLVQNQTDAAGVSNTFRGLNGANIGIAPSGNPVGTTFDDNAPKRIFDPNAGGTNANAAPYVGYFRPEVGSLLGAYANATAGTLNGTWTIRITDFRNGNVGFVQNAKLNIVSGLVAGNPTVITTTYVRALDSGGQTGTAANATGITPSPVIASDNTLGAYSPHQGRLYVAYVDKSIAKSLFQDNPADNTDVYLATSDDGGLSWTTSFRPVNDDNAVKDGYTEAGFFTPSKFNQVTGRPQFQPNVVVDQANGTVVLSWLDTRDDPSKARVATYLTTSIDGGRTFSKDVYANDPQTANDAITNQSVALEPVLENYRVEGANGFGLRQGLAAYGGHAYPIWSGDGNGGNVAPTPINLGIVTNTALYAAGPRVLSTTMGPVGEANDAVNSGRSADGTPQASAFQVVFDRPVDPKSFSASDVRVLYRDTTPGNLTGGFVPVTSVVPLDNGVYGATTFLVSFAPRSGIGTYSLAVLPGSIRDSIRSTVVATTASGPAVTVSSTDVPKTTTPGALNTSTLDVAGFPLNQVLANVTVNLSITSADASQITLTLVAPDGTTVPLARFEPFRFAGGQNYTNTTFDDKAALSIDQGTAPFTGSFRPIGPLSQLVNHPINGTWTLRVRVANVGQPSTLTNWSLSVTPGQVSTVTKAGNALDQNADGTPGAPTDFFASPMPATPRAVDPFAGPFLAGTLPLIVPGPHVASTSVVGAAPSADNLVLDRAVGSIDVVFDRDMDPLTITPASVLRVIGPAGPIAGPFTVTKNPFNSDPDPAHPRTYRIGFPAQQLSGTYAVTLGAGIADRNGNPLDTNRNGGVDLLRGTVTGPTTPITYTSNDVGLPLPGGRTTVSTLTVPDNYPVRGLTLQLNITDNNDPNLQITLVSPNNVPIVLVPRGTGLAGSRANFTDTVFDDAAPSLIQNGGAPFTGRFKPQQPLSAVNGSSAAGTWKLIVDDDPGKPNATSGRLNSWSLTFQKGVPSSGLGEATADQATVTFRIFNTSPANHLASSTWTPVGPASVVDVSAAAGTTNGYSGRVTAIAIDPSDPSGNTVYVGAASGGIWKTSNFLTTSPQGPTYLPLTDFGPTSAVNIGSIAVFARNGDPKQSIVVAGTGAGNSSGGYGGNVTTGVGFLISKDGGSTWTLSGSDIFAPNGGTYTNKVVVDPRPSPSGQVIIYAAMGDNNPGGGGNPSRNGLWRSDDTGQTWNHLTNGVANSFDTPATDVILDLNSGTVDALSNPTGNVNNIYVAYPGLGVYISPNRGIQLNHLAGGGVLPLIIDDNFANSYQVPVDNGAAPSGFPGNTSKIVLAKPDPLPPSVPNFDVLNTLYQGWLYAAVTGASDTLDGLYLTKDYGQTWTHVKLSTLPDRGLLPNAAVPTNDPNQPDYDPTSSQIHPHGGYNVSLAVDPTNPAVVYLGGSIDGKDSGLIRVDTTRTYDTHAFVNFDSTRPDGGAYQFNTTGRSQVVDNTFGPGGYVGSTGSGRFFPTPTINLIQDPANPFQTNATLFVDNVVRQTNDGSGTRWIPVDAMLKSNANDAVPSSNVHRIIPFLDPLTGGARLLIGDDQGIFSSVLKADGTVDPGVGNAPSASYSRNGNLQTEQYYYGASQPSNVLVNNQIASALFLANGQGLGQTGSDPKILTNGDIVGVGSTNGATLGIVARTSGDQNGTGVAVDQQGNDVVYRFLWPQFGGNVTDFFQVSVNGGPFLSRTFGLVQGANDPQWPGESPIFANGLPYGNFAINPINSDQVLISSAAGRVFGTINQGRTWQVVADPSSLDGSYAPALTFAAPDPNAPAGVGTLNNFLYAGTVNGNIFMTQTGGGTWTAITPGGGLDGSPVMKIVADPTRGNHDAYAVTQNGVYYNPDTVTGGVNGWTNVTGNLFALNSTTNPGFGPAAGATPLLNYLTSIVADWRYVIPNTGTGGGTHPMLYVSGDTGVFRSTDNGATWTAFPNQAIDGAPADGGYLPHVHVTDLTASVGKIDPTTGRPLPVAGDSDSLLATTFGRGQFAIRLAPVVFPSSVVLDPKLPLPAGSAGGGKDSQGRPIVTVAQPYFDGLSEATSFGNVVRISILDLTVPGAPRIIGGYDPARPSTDVAANWTDAAGKFAVQVNPNGFLSNGVKTIGIQATDLAGVVGNPATLTFTLNAKLSQQNQPPATPTILLNPADDTSGGLNVTSNTSPRIIGATDPGVQVQLFKSGNLGVPLATGTTDALGNYSLQFPASPDGSYSVVVVATNANGSTTSPALAFKIKTSAPTAAATLGLDPNDDTGIKGDLLTTTRIPHFVGVTDPGNKVTLYRVDPVTGLRQPGSLVTVTADPSGQFSAQLPFALTNGTITLIAGITDIAGNAGPDSTPLKVTITTTNADYNGDGTTDPALFRRTTAPGALFFVQGVSPSAGTPFGASNLDIPFAGDFSGSGVNNLAVYRPSNHTWYIRLPSGDVSYVLGGAGSVPVVGNFDGNGVTETAAFTPATGTWTVNSSINGIQTFTFPASPDPSDVPVPGDYEGTGTDELAVYRAATRQFLIKKASGVVIVNLSTGTTGDIPVPGNYDDAIGLNPIHRTLPAVYNPTTGQWLIAGVAGNRTVQFARGDIPAPGDYNGQGQTQTVVFRPSTATFYGPNATTVVQALGKGGDIPLTAPLVYRNVVANAPTLTLDAASDTGVKGDNVTSARLPSFTGTTDPNTLVDLLGTNGAVLNTVSSDAAGTFHIAPAAAQPNGSIAFQARAHGPVSSTGPTSPAVNVTLVTVGGDYSGTGRTAVAVFRRVNPGVLQWFVQGYGPLASNPFGAGSLDVPLSADFNGDGKADPAVYRPSTAQWFYQDSAAGYAGKLLTTFGWAGVDIPIPGDYNGTGSAIPAVYRPTTGEFFVQGTSGATILLPGKAGDVPVPGNYDNTGKDELAVFRPGTGQWVVQGPTGTASFFLGGAGDVPVPGAYDATASGRATELAVFSPTTGQWTIRGPNGNRTLQFAKGDIPAPGDYEGTGVTEAAVFRPSTAQWLVMSNSDRSPRVLTAFGWANHDVPPNTPYRYRAVSGGTSGGITTASISTASVPTPGPAPAPAALAVAIPMNSTPTPAPTPTAPGRNRPNQSTATKAHGHGHTLTRHPLLAPNRIPLTAAAATRKGTTPHA